MTKKIKLFSIVTLLIAGILSNGSLAQDYTQWQLPEGAKMRLGKGVVNDITFSPAGTQFAVATTIGIWIYDAHTGEELALLTGHEREVKAVEYSPDGRTFTTVDAGGETRLWDAITHKRISILTEPTDLVRKVTLSSDGTKLVTANMDDTFRLWHLAGTDQEPILINDTEQSVLAMALSPDGRILATSKTPHHNTISRQIENFRLQVWDTTTQEMLFSVPGDTAQIHTLAFLTDGRTLISSDIDGKTLLWDVDTGTSRPIIKENEGRTRTLALSLDGKYLATGDSDGNAQLWDITTEAQQHAPRQVFRGHRHRHRVFVWAFSPDGKTLLTTSESGNTRAWDTETGKQRFTITGHIGPMLHLTFSETGDTLTSINSPNSSWLWAYFQHRQWDVTTGKPLSTHFLEVVGAEKISPDGKTVLVDHRDGTLDITDLHTKRTRSTLKGNMKDELNVQFVLSLDGKVLAGVGKDRIIRVWKSEQSTWRRFFSRLPWGRSFFGSNPQFTFKVDKKDGFGALALSPDGKILAHARTLPRTVNTTVYLYSTETGEDLRTLKAFTDRITNLVFSPDGKTIAGGSREAIHLWDTSTGTQLRVCTLERLAASVTFVFSPDSKILVSAVDGTVLEFPDGAVKKSGGGWITKITGAPGGGVIQLWDSRTGELLSSHTGHTGDIKTLVFSKDQKTLASGGADSTILLWDWETLKRTGNRQ